MRRVSRKSLHRREEETFPRRRGQVPLVTARLGSVCRRRRRFSSIPDSDADARPEFRERQSPSICARTDAREEIGALGSDPWKIMDLRRFECIRSSFVGCSRTRARARAHNAPASR